MTATLHRLRRDLTDSLLLTDEEIELYDSVGTRASRLRVAADAIRYGRTPRERQAAARYARRLAEGVVEATDKYLPVPLEDNHAN